MRRIIAALVAAPVLALASSHREAPATAEDPAMDPADLYVFRSPTDDPDGKDTITIVATWWPFEDPGGGPSYPQFANDAIYRILIDNDGDGREDIVYQLSFETKYASTTSPLATGNVSQVATLARLETRGNKRTEQKDIAVAPIDSGAQSFPASGGKSSDAVYEEAAQKAITPLTVKGGGKLFLGPRDDPFFADLGAIFDLLQVRFGGGIDYLAGYNVHAIVLQVPIATVTADAIATPPHGKRSVIGVWVAGTRRKQITIGPDNKRAGVGYQQVSRLGLPLVNALLVPLATKDAYNATSPRDDVKTLGPYLADPELAKLLKATHRIAVPGPKRSDLLAVLGFNLGKAPLDVQGLLAADVLRLDVSVPASSLSPKSRLGWLGGDPAGFPNGRRLGDDVVDITERIVGGALCVKGKTCDIDPMTTPIGDGVDQNDRAFSPRFPYLAPPHAGGTGSSIHGKPPPRP
jgi:hypothetical protein